MECGLLRGGPRQVLPHPPNALTPSDHPNVGGEGEEGGKDVDGEFRCDRLSRGKNRRMDIGR